MNTKYQEMIALNTELQKACKAYYMDNSPIMSDKEFDRLYDIIVAYEKKIGEKLPNSVTNTVGYPVVSQLTKEKHEEKALSLNKTKNAAELVTWANGMPVVISWKLDGLTIVATYNDGTLVKAVTRGDGITGENVTHNAKFVKGLPQTIPFKDKLIVRGEALITYAAMDKVNANLKPGEQPYTLARSLASGSIRKLDSSEMANRGIEFMAFELVSPVKASFKGALYFLQKLGFATVPNTRVSAKDIPRAIADLSKTASDYPYPVDGLVCMIDDVAYGKSLGYTDKYPLYGMAFKWADTTYQTTIHNITWQASRTGRINPVAEFDTVTIDGSKVRRATCNNLTYMEEKGIGVGSVITVYKANMIIPTIDKVVENPQPLSYPSLCPSCNQPTTIVTGENGSKFLYCTCPTCPSKMIEHFNHFVSRDALNIVGLAKNTMQRLIDEGFVHTYGDLFRLAQYRTKLQDTLGKKTTANLLNAIEASRQTTLDRLIYSMGIENIGRRVSKDISLEMSGDITKFLTAIDTGFDFRRIEGIGDVLYSSLYNWFLDPNNKDIFRDVAQQLCLSAIPSASATPVQNNSIAGKTFVVTGKVYHFPNRNALGAFIEEHGGKLASSVSSKTNYLVNNDVTSTSGKNKKAQSLGVPIISEDDLLKMIG